MCVCMCLLVCGERGGDLGVKVIPLESVFKARVDTQAQTDRDDCGLVEILSQKLCKTYKDIHAIPPSLSLIFSLTLSLSLLHVQSMQDLKR